MIRLFLLFLPLCPFTLASIQLTKCCPTSQVLDTSTLTCVPGEFANLEFANLYTLAPVFGSHYFALMDHADDDDALAQLEEELESPEIAWNNVTKFPDCQWEFEEKRYLSSPDNSVLSSDFFLNDDVLLKAPEHALISLVEAGKPYTDFCLDRARRSSDHNFVGTFAVVCNIKKEFLCEKKLCVQRCCPKFQVFVNNRCSPTSNPEPDLPPFVVKNEHGVEVDREDIEMIYESVPQNCTRRYIYRDFELNHQGIASRKGRSFNHSLYCVERFESDPDKKSFDEETYDLSEEIDDNHEDEEEEYDNELARLSRLTYDFKLVVCETSDIYESGYLLWQRLMDFTLVPLLFLVSMIFLALLAIVVYIRNRHKLFGAMTLCLVSMLLIFYLLLLLTKVAGQGLIEDWPKTCLISALIIQFTYLSAVFWLNAMSFDIWRSFRRMQAKPMTNRPQFGWRHPRFKWLALYSWLGPFLIVLMTLVMQLLPKSTLSFVVRPEIGSTRCFLDQKWAMVAYLHMFVAPLLLSNFLFFGLSTFNLCCGLWADKKGDPGVRKQQKSRFVSVTKMFFAMGITWIAETASLVLEWNYGRENVSLVVSVFSIVNSLQGVILFLVIVCEPATIRRCRARILGKKVDNNANNNASNMNRCATSSSVLSSLRSRIKMSCKNNNNNNNNNVEMSQVGNNNNNNNVEMSQVGNNNNNGNSSRNKNCTKENEIEINNSARNGDNADEPDAILQA